MSVQSILDKLIEKLLASDSTASSEIDENDINIEDSGTIGRTPLMAVASEGLTESFEMLISKGALVNTRGKWCMTALHEASSNGHVEIAHRLIALGADVNAETTHGVTPLMCAAAWGNCEIVILLVDNGADVSKVDCSGATAFDIAREKGADDVADILVAKMKTIGPPDNERDRSGNASSPAEPE